MLQLKLAGRSLSELSTEAAARLDAVGAVLPRLIELLPKMQSGDLGIRTKSNDMDLVTLADLASEEIILEAIARHFPADAVLAEESGAQGNVKLQEFTWAIDPVDGTINFAHGLPLYSVSIGLLHRGQPVAGVLCQPALGSTYRAVQGQGATRNGQPISVSPETRLDRGLVVTGFPYNRAEILPTLLEGVRGILTSARGLRRTGSAALDLCWLADGKFVGLYELNLSAWDSSAGAILVREAGGQITNLIGEQYDPFGHEIAASNGAVHQDLLQMLSPVAAAVRQVP